MHPSMESIMRGFSFSHLEEGSDARAVSSRIASQAIWISGNIPSSSEVVAGLRKLLEAKDCFVRAAVWAEQDAKKNAAEGANEA